MRIEDVFPSKYLKAADLKKQEVQVVISSVDLEDVGEERRLVLHFQNKDRGMICNKTNSSRISYLYGPETDNWIGKAIILYPELVDFQGRTVEGLRVRPPRNGNGKPTAVAATPAPAPVQHDDAMDDDIPF